MRVLVVEDDTYIREVMATALKGEGFTVEVAPDGVVALELLARRDFDLVVLDIALPRLDGLSLCRRIRSRPQTADLPVLVVSAMSGNKTFQAVFEVGANAFLEKPFDIGEFVGHALDLTGRSVPLGVRRDREAHGASQPLESN